MDARDTSVCATETQTAEYLDSDDAAVPPGHASPVAPPVDVCQATVTRIWMEELGLEQVEMTDDFFDLGGMSLQVVKVIQRTRAELEIKIRPAALFEASRLGDFIARVRAGLATK